MKVWIEPERVSVPRPLREAVGGHPLVAETLVRRGYDTPEAARAFMDPAVYTPAPPDALPGMDAAVARIERALAQGERICVWGDFDVDGQTSTTLLVSVLRQLSGDVIYHIPLRDRESHGVRRPWLDQELAKGVGLLVTCDTGIDAVDAVAYAQTQGVDVVITDHHELPPELPAAVAIVNPHLLEDGHPLGTLPGVGVAYELALALTERAGCPELAAASLDLVALGIVADVAVQTGDTRYLLQQGLAALRETSRLGLRELMKIAGVQPGQVDAETIGFTLGPRLNALGRLGDANTSVEFLTTEDLTRARILASRLEALNAKRKNVCDQVYAAALAKVDRDPSLLDGSALVVADPSWPAGVIGIVANRLVEQYNLPVVLLTAPPGELAHGSARSVAGCHITEAIATQQDLLASFGGHAMAAGLAIAPERIDRFRRGLTRAVSQQMSGGRAAPSLTVDGYLTLGELSLSLVTDLQRLAPFGAGNPQLVLVARDVRVTAQRPLGRQGYHLRVTVEDRHRVQRNAVWWNWRNAPLPEGWFDLAFTVRVNEFRGAVDVQVVWQDARPAEEEEPAVVPAEPRTLEVLDYRDAPDPYAALASLREATESMEVWAEGPHRKAVNGKHRLELGTAETLVIWSCPPGVEAVRIAFRRVDPTRVVLIGQGLESDEPRVFLSQLAGLVKYAMRSRDGTVNLAELAAVMGHREISVKQGLALLEAQGGVRVQNEGELVLRVEDAGVPAPEREEIAREALIEALAETVAYRRHFTRANKDRVVAELALDVEA